MDIKKNTSVTSVNGEKGKSNTSTYRAKLPSHDGDGNQDEMEKIRKSWFQTKFEKEPPRLTLEEKSTLSEILTNKNDVETKAKQIQIKINSVIDELRRTKDQISRVQNKLQFKHDIDGEAQDPDLFQSQSMQGGIEFVQDQKELMRLINAEEKLQNDLSHLRIQIAELNISQQNVTLKIEEELSNLIQTNELRKEFDYQRRLYKEFKIQKNVIKRYNTAVKKMESEAEERKQVEDALKIENKEKFRQIRESYTKLLAFRREAFKKMKEKKLQTKADQQLINETKYANLMVLKSEIDNQREMLNKEAKERTRKAKLRIAKRDKRRQELMERGENPYVQEYKFKIQKRETEIKWKIMSQEQLAYHKIREEILEAERIKRKKEKDREKWDKFWAEKAEEKRRERIRKSKEIMSLDKTNHPTLLQVIKQQNESSDGKFQREFNNFDLFLKEAFGNLFDDDSKEKEEGADVEKYQYDQPESDQEKEEEFYDSSHEIDLEIAGEDLMTRSLSPGKVLASGHKRLKSIWHKKKAPHTTHTKDHKARRKSVPHVKMLGKKSIEVEEEDLELEIEGESEAEIEGEAEVKVEVPKEEEKHEVIGVLSKKPSPIAKRAIEDLLILKPPAVIFKDFHIGKTYKIKARIMNKSDERIKLYFDKFIDTGEGSSMLNSMLIDPNSDPKPPPSTSKYPFTPPNTVADNDETELKYKRDLSHPLITDFVKIQFEIPKPILQGLSHQFVVTFKPTFVADFQGEIYLDSKFGQVIIPVYCKRPRFEPQLKKNTMTFKNIIGGTFGCMTMKLVNHGAFPGQLVSVKIIDKARNSMKLYKENQDKQAAQLLNEPATIREQSSSSPSGKKGKSKVTITDSKIVAGERRLSTTSRGVKNASKPLLSGENSQIRGTESKNRPANDLPLSRKKSVIPKSTIKDIAKNVLDEIFESVTDHIFSIYSQDIKRILEPKEEITLKIHFKPPAVDYFCGKFELVFDNNDMKMIQLDVEGFAVENPITAEPLNTNMKICLMNFSYQQPIYIHNTSSVAGIVKPLVPLYLRKYVEVFPKKAHSFAGQKILFSMKFRPQPELTNHHEIRFKYFDPVTNILDFEIPFELEFPFPVPGPIICTFQTLLDEPNLEINPLVMDLGKCFVPEIIKKKITIKNTSVVPQQIGFIDLPKFVTILPSYGFTVILPGESRTFDAFISLGNAMNGDTNFRLKIKTLQKKEYIINVKGSLEYADLKLTNSKILFPATCFESISTAIAELLSNISIQSKKDFVQNKFEFHIDENIPIKIIPSAGYIGIAEKMKLLIKFEPKINSNEIQKLYRNNLEDQFQANKVNLNNELNAINIEIANSKKKSIKKPEDVQLPTGVRKGSRKKSKIKRSIEKDVPIIIPEPQENLDRKLSTSTSHSQGSMKMGSEASGSQHSADKLSNPPSKKSFQPKIIIRTIEDLQQIISNGTPDLTQPIQTLIQRKKFIIDVALQADLSSSTTNDKISTDTDSKEYMELKKKLVSSLKPSVNEYKIPCSITVNNSGAGILFLTLKCPTIVPDLIILNNNETIKFGSVEIGKQIIKEIYLYNSSIGTILPKTDILNPYGSFIQVNAIRQIGPEETFTLKIKFCPKSEGTHEDSVYIYGGESKILVSFFGECGVKSQNEKPIERKKTLTKTIDSGY